MKTIPLNHKNQTIEFGQPHDECDPNSRVFGDTIMMQLATMTYCSTTNNVASTLAKCMPDWEIAWIPSKAIKGIWAFVVKHKMRSSYVLAIRGSLLTPTLGALDNWLFQDLNVFKQVPWEYSTDPNSKPMIAEGTQKELEDLNSLVNDTNIKLWDFLVQCVFSSHSDLILTGHSLGANLATVYAAYLKYNIQQHAILNPPLLYVMTFASPTSWNADFAKEFDKQFSETSWKYYNVLDIVPNYVSNITAIGDLFPPPAPLAAHITVTFKVPITHHTITVSLQDALKLSAGLVKVSEEHYNSFYTPVNQSRGSIALNTKQKIYGVDTSKPAVEQWFAQVAAQHASAHYLEFLGADPIPCSAAGKHPSNA